MRYVRVGVNGYGTIGKRVAWAVMKQPDMKLVGVIKTRPNWEALSAISRGISIYAPKERIKVFEDAGIKVSGSVEDLLSSIDVVVDATPAGTGVKYLKSYVRAGVKTVFQGGEPASIAPSFNPLYNYEKVLGRDRVRVVSCNTTGILRVLHGLMRVAELEVVRGVIIRRGADLKEVGKGPIEGLILKPVRPPSHHSEDVKRVIGDWLNILTYSVIAPTTLAHLHVMYVRFKERVRREDIIDSLKNTPRVIVAEGVEYPSSTAELRELARDLGRGGDIYEVVVWGDSVWVNNYEAGLAYMVHQESIVIPDNIDAIRALTKLAVRADESIRITDTSLGIKGWVK